MSDKKRTTGESFKNEMKTLFLKWDSPDSGEDLSAVTNSPAESTIEASTFNKSKDIGVKEKNDKDSLPSQDTLPDKEPLPAKDSSDKDSLPAKDSSDQVSLSDKDSLPAKETLSPKELLPQKLLPAQDSLPQDSLPAQDSLPLSPVVDDAILVDKVDQILLDQNLTQSAKILLSHLIIKNKTFKVRFTYRHARDSLNMSMPTVIKAVDSLRTVDNLEVFLDGYQGTIIDCSKSFLRKLGGKVSLPPHDNNYLNVLKNKYFNIMTGQVSLALIALLAISFDLKKQDFSRSVLLKMKDLTIDSIALVFAYTVKKVPHSGNARAGYIYKTVEHRWDQALDLDIAEKAKNKIPILERMMKAKMNDLGRKELIEIAGKFGRVVSEPEETEKIRTFVEKKLEESKELEKRLIKALSEGYPTTPE